MTLFVPPSEPSYGAQRKKEYRILTNDFGDGYEQNTPDGLNSKRETWDIAWNGLTEADADSIDTQIDSFGGLAFSWVTPKGQTKNFRCASLNRAYVSFENFNVTATFVESFS